MEQQQEKQVTLQITINQLNVIMSGLVKLPIEIGLDTFQFVQQQANQQLGPAQGPMSSKVVQ